MSLNKDRIEDVESQMRSIDFKIAELDADREALWDELKKLEAVDELHDVEMEKYFAIMGRYPVQVGMSS